LEQKNRFTRSNLDQTVEMIYDYIVIHIRKEGYPPSVREICSGIGIKSTSTIHSHLKRLQDMGKIEYTPGKRRAIIVPDLQQENTINLPVLGTITAGIPILAEENIERTLPFSSDLFSSGEHFVLKVRGDSMINAHILHGDFVIVKRLNSAALGQIIVARIGDEATVKTLISQDGRMFLRPENPAYSPIPFDHEDCQILGVVTGLFRSSM
jgi:repressor LexA